MTTIEEVLAEERKHNTLDIEGLAQFLYTSDDLAEFRAAMDRKNLPYDYNIFNKSRAELIKESFRIWPEALKDARNTAKVSIATAAYSLGYYHQLPGTIHKAMFMKCIDLLGTDYQRQEYLPKCQIFEMIGCYAQTELGHGSDVQNLQTTATYVLGGNEFIINTPTVSAAKYWPGDMGIMSTHALVFAQLIISGKSNGVHAFIVPIRDQKTFKALPNIEVGDIGPKIGFHTKDNGYLLMHDVRIPKNNMLRRFISVSKNGEIKKKGDPKVSYATMMVIRQAISCFLPKAYSQAIIIGARYSLFRKQFTDKYKNEIRIIDYQAQKDKIITRIAEYYAIIVGGNQIKAISDTNLNLVKNNNDFSLMNQSHVCLCIGKAFFSETVYEGMQICRRACGGHGFSHYSGFPSLLSEYVSNLTYEGQNTVLYLQIARFILKSYKNHLTKKKSLGQSVKYIDSYQHLLEKRIQADREDSRRWTLEDMRILLAQNVCYLVSKVTEKMINKAEGESELDVWNGAAGIDIKRVGLAHSIYYTFDTFREAVFQVKHQANREILRDLCLLYGAHLITSSSSGIIEGGFVLPGHITSLLHLKGQLLEKIRPQVVGLLDGFAIPEHLLRSGLAFGNPYENYLNMAQKCQLNEKVNDSAIYVRDGIKKALAMHEARPKL